MSCSFGKLLFIHVIDEYLYSDVGGAEAVGLPRRVLRAAGLRLQGRSISQARGAVETIQGRFEGRVSTKKSFLRSHPSVDSQATTKEGRL